MKFVHLHNHSMYSIQDGIPAPKEYLAKAEEMGMSAVAITDHGSLASVADLYFESKNYNVKPIYGCEFYMVDNHAKSLKLQEEFKELKGDERKEKRRAARKNHHILLLAKNQKGLENLFGMNYAANKDGFYY